MFDFHTTRDTTVLTCGLLMLLVVAEADMLWMLTMIFIIWHSFDKSTNLCDRQRSNIALVRARELFDGASVHVLALVRLICYCRAFWARFNYIILRVIISEPNNGSIRLVRV